VQFTSFILCACVRRVRVCEINVYPQLAALGRQGYNNVKAFVTRNAAQQGESSYAGFCAGGYMAARDYLWESKYEGPGYFAFQKDPPFDFFHHSVEGCLYDITDENFGLSKLICVACQYLSSGIRSLDDIHEPFMYAFSLMVCR